MGVSRSLPAVFLSVQLTFVETFQTASPLLQSRMGEGPPFSGSPVPGHCSHR